MQVVEDVTGGTLQQVIDKTIAPGAKIECDGYRSYKNLSGVELDAKQYEPGDLHWLHKAISNLKAFLLGTYHGRCTQLQSYLDEFCFRFNRRKTGDRSSCAWQEPSLHLVPSCIKPISTFLKISSIFQGLAFQEKAHSLFTAAHFFAQSCFFLVRVGLVLH